MPRTGHAYLHEVEALPTDRLVFSDSKVGQEWVVANVGSVAIPLNVHCPLTSPSSQKNNIISEPPLRTTIGVPQGRLVYVWRVSDAVLKGVR